MARPAPLLVVYDAENTRYRRWMDWVRRRDTRGLIVTFPFQNPELVKIAPELAGRPLHLLIHGLDTHSRQVWSGDGLLPEIWRRLPGWGWVIFLTRSSFIRRIIKIVNPRSSP